MSRLPDNTPIVPLDQSRGEIIYLTKRPGYTLAIIVPQASPTCLSWQQAVVQVHLQRRGQLWSCVLNPPELEAFYSDLRELVEYWREWGEPLSAKATRG